MRRRGFPTAHADIPNLAPMVDVDGKNGLWTCALTLPRTRLTALYRGNGARHDPVSFRGTLLHRAGKDQLKDAQLTIGSITLTPSRR